MKRSQVFPSTYLSKDDVPSPFRATIGTVRMETIKGDGGEEEKPVLHFQNDSLKAMILNSTNWSILEESYGEESDEWQGKTVEVYVDPGVMFAGRRVGGVRLRVPHDNGHTFDNGFWTFDQAVAKCAEVGIKREDLIAKLKSTGLTGFKSERDTALVKSMILQAGNGTSEEQAFEESQIPF